MNIFKSILGKSKLGDVWSLGHLKRSLKIEDKLLFKFDKKESIEKFKFMCDTDIGGKSTAKWSWDEKEKCGVLEGNLSIETSGKMLRSGYAAIVSKEDENPLMDLSDYDALELKIRCSGENQIYVLNMKCESARPTDLFQAFLTTDKKLGNEGEEKKVEEESSHSRSHYSPEEASQFEPVEFFLLKQKTSQLVDRSLERKGGFKVQKEEGEEVLGYSEKREKYDYELPPSEKESSSEKNEGEKVGDLNVEERGREEKREGEEKRGEEEKGEWYEVVVPFKEFIFTQEGGYLVEEEVKPELKRVYSVGILMAQRNSGSFLLQIQHIKAIFSSHKKSLSKRFTGL